MSTRLFESNPVKLGKHEWRVVVIDAEGRAFGDGKTFTEYEFRRALNPDFPEDFRRHFRRMEGFPGYNSNDGLYAGCPRGLRKLYDANLAAIKAARVAAGEKEAL